MAIRYGNREQTTLLPASIDEYVSETDPVRVYDVFIDSLNFKELGIDLSDDRVGNTRYDPVAMLKLLVYGYSYGWRSSRKLERAIHHNLSFIWLMGGLQPDHKTIANFRCTSRKALSKVLKQCARLCLRLALIAGNTLFVDGTRLRANASLSHSWDKGRCQKMLVKLDKRIDEILNECDTIDNNESGNTSLVSLHKELEGKSKLKKKVSSILQELEAEDKNSVNTVDPDCVSTRSTHGSFAGYNAQIVVDERHGLIANADVVNRNNDQCELANQVNQANEIAGNQCEIVVADGGYESYENFADLDEQGITVIVPTQAHNDHLEGFSYNKEDDYYICPEGHKLHFIRIEKDRQRRRYHIRDKKICQSCKRFGSCTSSVYGRTLGVSMYEEVACKVKDTYNSPLGQQMYQLRKQRVELPFGHIRRNLKVNAFLLRGLDGVRAEMSLLATCFNLRRMITLLGLNSVKTALTS
jgi:transposase